MLLVKTLGRRFWRLMIQQTLNLTAKFRMRTDPGHVGRSLGVYQSLGEHSRVVFSFEYCRQ